MAAKSLEGELVEFDRKPIDPNILRGFALAWSADLTLLHVVNDSRMELDGDSLIRNADVFRWRRLGPKKFMARALKLKKISPQVPEGVLCADWAALLESAGDRFPLMTIHREKINRHVCYVGRFVKMTEKLVILQTIDPEGRWEGQRHYRLSDITKVDFGGGYEEALALVAADNRRKRK